MPSPRLVTPKPHLSTIGYPVAKDADLGLISANMAKITNQPVEPKKPKTGS
jgi:hypothetical protein